MKRQTILSRNMKKGALTKNQLLTEEMRSRHRIKVATQNAVDSKTAKSRHRTKAATYNLLKGQKNVVATKINIVGNRNDVATWN